MGINFQFATSTQIIFENGSFKKVPDLIKKLGKKVLIVTGKNTILANQLSDLLNQINIEFEIFGVHAEPTTIDIEKGTKLVREMGCKVIVGVGGGSVIDSAKAIAALATNIGELNDYLEVIGKGRKLVEPPLPFIAIPTTAGTGAEVTKNAVIKSTHHNVKVSLRSDFMFPDIALIDPELTISMPPHITASTGVDALTHLLETFVSCQSNPFIDMLCREGMKRISTSLENAYFDGENKSARENMAMASLLGGMYPIPHGAVCACLLPAVMEVNIATLKDKKQHNQLLKYNEVAQILTGIKTAVAGEGVVWIKELVKKLQIPTLSDFNLSTDSFPKLIEKAKNSSSMKGNPVELNNQQLMKILEKSI